MHCIALFAILLLASDFVNARKWYDTGSGTIVLEEAWIPQELLFQISNTTAALGSTNAELKSNLLDIHNQRLELMNQNNIDFMVISCAQPCIQGISDPDVAMNMAVMANNRLAASISNNTARFGAFASLAMHNATVAAQELKRAVTELGFLGALVNDYQQSGADNSTLLYYDQPEYDVFWQMVSELNVPVYFHPRMNIPQISSLLYHHAHFLSGAPQEYAATLSTHILGLCTNGVFDRFPNVKIIVGHLGERIPSDLVRIDEQLLRQKANGMPMLKNASSYWRTNIFETTSGNFATSLLQFHAEQIGLDRILFSIDYPFVSIPEGSAWVDTLAKVLSKEELTFLKRGLAIKLLRLNN
ncbi:amidohydrolase 2 [Cyathus striatus]|nr:amidohydrolase 2 [Cyathus striatus]